MKKNKHRASLNETIEQVFPSAVRGKNKLRRRLAKKLYREQYRHYKLTKQRGGASV